MNDLSRGLGMEREYSDERLMQGLADTNVSTTEFLERFSKNIATLLRDKPHIYRSFGMYWWHVKALLLERQNDPTAWWFNGTVDEWAMEMSDRGSEAKNIMQAIIYHRDNWTNSGQHDYVYDGVQRHYSLYDEQLGE